MKGSANIEMISPPKHGGRLQEAANKYGIPIHNWMDLSTGINPQAWPIPSIPTSVWARLPEADDGLIAAASKYYNTENLLPVSGSQAAISALPKMRKSKLRKSRATSRVGVLSPGYAEHAYCWKQAGHDVVPLSLPDIETAIESIDVLVLINPNNPTGERILSEVLLKWREQLASKGGWLIVDEAFMDCTPQYSIAKYSYLPGLIVLRSLGKFFGLAGIRVGFVCAQDTLLESLDNYLGPWTVAGPSRYTATKALQDQNWQIKNRESLAQQGQRLGNLLAEFNLAPTGSTSLFHWVVTEKAENIHKSLANKGILTRLFDSTSSLRF